MVKVILNGCGGKMGHMVMDASKQFKDLEIIAGIDKFAEGTDSFKVFKCTNDVNIDYDVILDFSRADALDDLLALTEKTKKPLVLCSTGYTKEQLDLINEKSKTLPLFKSANMSLGINLINNLLKKVAPMLYGNYDIEIVEKHHNQKIDAPSGTALMIANAINETRNDDMKYTYDRHSQRKKREPNEIGIHAVRGGTIVGVHEVLFAGNDETITISHSAASKTVFAEGSINAAIFVKSQKPGLYDMGSIVG